MIFLFGLFNYRSSGSFAEALAARRFFLIEKASGAQSDFPKNKYWRLNASFINYKLKQHRLIAGSS
jgi:hypothetical protein